jgi:hypothetical protein
MKWTEHVAGTGEAKMHTKFWPENLKEADHLRELQVD